MTVHFVSITYHEEAILIPDFFFDIPFRFH